MKDQVLTYHFCVNCQLPLEFACSLSFFNVLVWLLSYSLTNGKHPDRFYLHDSPNVRICNSIHDYWLFSVKRLHKNVLLFFLLPYHPNVYFKGSEFLKKLIATQFLFILEIDLDPAIKSSLIRFLRASSVVKVVLYKTNTKNLQRKLPQHVSTWWNPVCNKIPCKQLKRFVSSFVIC